MFVLARAVTYAALFIGFLLIYLPARVLTAWGVRSPDSIGWPQVAGLVIGAVGAALALACIFTFVVVGKGTPAPFDPPRRLVVRGPYRLVRNPMYLGAGLALAGGALYYESRELLIFTAAFLVVMHLFVVIYEEPVLRATFGDEYTAYCTHTRRWWLRWRRGGVYRVGSGHES